MIKVIIWLSIVYSSLATTCTGGDKTYYYDSLILCNDFTGLTQQTNIVLNGTTINDISLLSNINFGTWPGTLTIDRTSLISINQFSKMQSVGSIIINNNDHLEQIQFSMISADLVIITNNGQLTNITFDLLNTVTQLNVIDNSKLSFLEFQSLLSLSNLKVLGNKIVQLSGFNQITNIDTLEIQDFSLQNITGFSSLNNVGSVTIANSSIRSINNMNILQAISIQLLNLPIGNLNFIRQLNQANSLRFDRLTELLDYSGLKGLMVIPPTFSVIGSCCPKASDRSMVIPGLNFFGCQDCVTFQALSFGQTNSTQIPLMGQMYLNISYTGSIEYDYVEVTFGVTTTVNCTVSSTLISCISPTFNTTGIVSLWVSIGGRPKVNTGLTVTYVSNSDYFGELFTNTTVINNNQNKNIPGVIQIDNAYISLIAYLVLGLSIGFIGLLLIAYAFRKKLPCCCCLQSKAFKQMDFLYTFIDSSNDIVSAGASPAWFDDKGPLLHRRKTTFGGLMTLAAIFSSIVITIVWLFSALSTRNTSITTQEPRFYRSQNTYVGQMTLLGYNRRCSTAQVSAVGLGGIQIIDRTMTSDGCLISWSATSDMPTDHAQIFFFNSDPNALSLGFKWSIQVNDYFGQPSIASGQMAGKIFKGASSQAFVKLTQSRYVDGNEKYGVLAYADNQIANTVEDLADGYGVSVMLDLQMNQSNLNVAIINNLSPLSILAICSSIIGGSIQICRLINIMYHKYTGRTRNGSPRASKITMPSV